MESFTEVPESLRGPVCIAGSVSREGGLLGDGLYFKLLQMVNK